MGPETRKAVIEATGRIVAAATSSLNMQQVADLSGMVYDKLSELVIAEINKDNR